VSSEPLTMVDFMAAGEGPDLGDVEIDALDAALRSVIFTDGTVTRALEVQALAEISVDVVSQERTAAPPAEAALPLVLADGEECLRRRVTMRARSHPDQGPCVWAESYIVPTRLPEDFLESLDGARQGIGESLQQLRVESWRDLLWCRRGTSPSWGRDGADPAPTITRLYRIVTNGRPALLISEAFAVYLESGRYRLVATRG
jgi:chorismate-pyruvate lyase